MSCLSMAELFGMGFGKAVTKHVAEQMTKKDYHVMNVVFNSAYIWYIIIGTLGCLICVGLGLKFEVFFKHVNSNLVHEGRISMYIIATAMIPCMSLSIFKAVLHAEQRYDLVNLVNVIRSVLRVLLVVGYFQVLSLR